MRDEIMNWIKSGVVSILLILVINCGGQKPSAPEITVPTYVLPNIADTFSAVSNDPNGDEIKYMFSWGNGIESNWSGYLASGAVCKIAYAYPATGTFYVKARAQDNTNKTSGWCEEIKVVCNYAPLLWDLAAEEDFDCMVNSTPAIDDQGNIYFGCLEGHIHCVNRGNGSQRWRYTAYEQGEVVASPSIASNGTIYTCDRDGYIYALNSNGSLKWQVQPYTTEILATPAIGRQNEIYVNTDDGLVAYSASGQEMWHIDSINGKSSVTIDQSNCLYVGTYDGYLYSLDTAGNIRWRYLTGDEIISSPTITSTGMICFGSEDGFFYMLNADGSLFRRNQIATSISQSAIIGADGSIYVTTDDGHLFKFDAGGAEQFDFITDGSACSSPAIVNDPIIGDLILFKASWAKKKTRQADEDSLYMVKSNGQELGAGWIVQMDASDGILASPMIGADGTIYIGGGIDDENDRGGLFALVGRGTLANSVWPLFRRDRKNTGRVQ
jgi:outer membrane protein assembly factor BamB